MDRLPVIPWRVIVPVRDSGGRIVDWRPVATIHAPDVIAAVNRARAEYGPSADVRSE